MTHQLTCQTPIPGAIAQAAKLSYALRIGCRHAIGLLQPARYSECKRLFLVPLGWNGLSRPLCEDCSDRGRAIMSSGYNCSTILSRVVGTPEQGKTKSGALYLRATIPLLTYRGTAYRQGEEVNTLLPVRISGKTAELFAKYVKKGQLVYLAGRLDGNEWIANGKKACRSASLPKRSAFCRILEMRRRSSD